MKSICLFALIGLSTALLVGCDRRDDPENIPTSQPTGETASPPTDPGPPTAPVQGEDEDNDNDNSADPVSGN